MTGTDKFLLRMDLARMKKKNMYLATELRPELPYKDMNYKA